MFASVICAVIMTVSNAFGAGDVNEAKKHYSFGIQQVQAGNDAEACRQFEKSIAIYDSLYQVYYAYADLLKKMDEKEQAIDAYEKVLELNPDYYNAAANLSRLYYETGNYTATLEMYNKMYTLKPENTKLLASIANIREFVGDENGAYEAMKKLIESGEDTYENLIRIAKYAFEREEIETAHMYAVMALGKKENDLTALELAGKTGMLMNDQKLAIKFYRKIAEIDSTSIPVLTIVEELYRALSDRENLIWALKRHHELDRANVNILGELCEIFDVQELNDEKIMFIQRGIELAPEDGRFHILMGENYRALGQNDKALEEFRLAMKDERWRASAQRFIWQIEKPETEEEKLAKEFFSNGNNQ